MTTKTIYLARIGSGNPFFNCNHHLEEVAENLKKIKKKDGTPAQIKLVKVKEAPGESCEHCLGDRYNDQFKKARKRALESYKKFMK